jgi:hypothetical protein
MHFSRQNRLFGVKKQGEGFVVRHGNDTTIRAGDKPAMAALYERLHESIREFYLAPVNQPRRQFGFVPPAKE